MNKELNLIVGLVIIFFVNILTNTLAWAYVDINYFAEANFWNITKIVGGILNVLFCFCVGILLIKYSSKMKEE